MTTPSQVTPIKKTEDKNSFEFSADDYSFIYTDSVGSVSPAIPTPLIAESFYGNGAIELGILPPVVRYISPDYMGCIIERPPQIHTLEFKTAYAREKETESNTQYYKMALPWTIYVVQLNPNGTLAYLNIFFRNSQIWTIQDPLYSACLPNTYPKGETCLDANRPVNTNVVSKTLAEGINNAISGFWSGKFNLDLSYFLDNRLSLPDYIAAKIKKSKSKTIISQATAFFKSYEEITINEALEIEYKDPKISVQNQILRLNNSCHLSSKSSATTVAGFFTPIINSAKKKL